MHMLIYLKRPLFWLFLFIAGVLLLIPAFLNGINSIPDSTLPAIPSRPIEAHFWSELKRTRQLVQRELNAPVIPHSASSETGEALGGNARQHFRQAMATLPEGIRYQPLLRDIQSEAEDDFELLQLQNRVIRKLAAQQLILTLDRAEQFVRAQH